MHTIYHLSISIRYGDLFPSYPYIFKNSYLLYHWSQSTVQGVIDSQKNGK